MQNESLKTNCVSLVIIRIEIDDLDQKNLNESTTNLNLNKIFEYNSPAHLAKQELKLIKQASEKFKNLNLEENDPDYLKQFIGKRQSQLIQIETYHLQPKLMQKNNKNSESKFNYSNKKFFFEMS